MKKVMILKNTSVKGEPCSPGEVKNLDDADARELISYNLAELLQEPEPEPQVPVKKLIAILDNNLKTVATALADLSVEDLNALSEAEANGETRKGVMKAINKELAAREEKPEE